LIEHFSLPFHTLDERQREENHPFRTCGHLWRTSVEIVGTVNPSNYTGLIVLHRIVEDKKSYDDMTLIDSQNNVADDSSPEFRDDDPQSGGSDWQDL
jgi:hypothetical protein